MILEMIAALSLPIWLAVEETVRVWRTRRHEARVVARKRAQQQSGLGRLLRT
jgi:hypothetical protein